MFLTHWLVAVMAAFGRGPVSAPHRHAADAKS
jgi:hypothetical protein